MERFVDFIVREMTLDDMRMVIEWAEQEGWNPGIDDASLMLSLEPRSFLVGCKASQPISAISVPAYDDSYAFVGYYLTRPAFQRAGYGYATWKAGMARAGDRILGLDAIMAQAANYTKEGFSIAHQNVRFVGRADPISELDDGIGSTGEDLSAIVAFDAAHSPAPRPDFAKRWLTAPDHRVRVARSSGRITGLGVARPAVDGYRVGPLYAETPAGATAVLKALMHDCGPNSLMTIDVPEPNESACSLAAELGFRPHLTTARMYKNGKPELPLERIFALTSTEIG